MKLESLKLRNFAKFSVFECKFDEKLTRLVGISGAGKTTIGLTSIWACIKGIAEKNKDGQLIGERFRFIGSSSPTSDIELTVYDEKTQQKIIIKNHITKQGNEITCSPVQDENWLNNLMSVAFISAKNFSLMDQKEQSILLGINTEKYDIEIKKLKEEFTIINRELKSFGELTPVEETKTVDYTSLIKEKESIEAEYYNKQRIVDENNRKFIERENQIKNCNEKIADIENQIKSLNEQLQKCNNWLSENKPLTKLDDINEPDLTEIREKINNSQAINNKASEYLRYKEKSEQKELKKKELEENQKAQEIKSTERLNYIKSFKFGFDGLTVDESGGLLLDGRPIKEPYFSKGELEKIVAKLYISRNPELKVRFIDDFANLDEDSQESLLKELFDQGFQVITAECGKKKVKDNTLLIKECKVVDEYSSEDKKLF